MSNWINGSPTIEEIERHNKLHPAEFDRGLWLVKYGKRMLLAMVRTTVFTVRENGEILIWSDEDESYIKLTELRDLQHYPVDKDGNRVHY